MSGKSSSMDHSNSNSNGFFPRDLAEIKKQLCRTSRVMCIMFEFSIFSEAWYAGDHLHLVLKMPDLSNDEIRYATVRIVYDRKSKSVLRIEKIDG